MGKRNYTLIGSMQGWLVLAAITCILLFFGAGVKVRAAKTVDLSEEKRPYKITGGGEYVLTGTSAFHGYAYEYGVVLIDPSEDVTITLQDVTIDVSQKAVAPIVIDGMGDDVDGTVTLILKGNNVLKAGDYCAGIWKGKDGKLVIKGDGSLSVTGGSGSAGIGIGPHLRESGAALNENDFVASDITIESGTVKATGGMWGAGIGAGLASEDQGGQGRAENITITGGTVTATGGIFAAGIGGGYGVSSAGIVPSTDAVGMAQNITITGGTVTAVGGERAAGIGGGRFGYGNGIYLKGGTVVANGYQAIGSGQDALADYMSTVYVEAPVSQVAAVYSGSSEESLQYQSGFTGSGEHKFTKREPWAKFLFGTGYTLQVRDKTGGTISGAGKYPEGASVRIQATMEENYSFQKWELEGPGMIENASQNPTTFTMGAGNATISAEYLTPQENGPFDVFCQGTSTYSYNATNHCLKLEGNGPFTVSVKEGQSTSLEERIWINGDDAEVTLQNIHLDLSTEEYANNPAALRIQGKNTTLRFEGENSFKSSDYGAGIQKESSGTLTLLGEGNVEAVGGSFAAGIGGKFNNSNSTGDAGNNIVIAGGTILAEGGTNAAAIGGARSGDANNIQITGGTVTANGGHGAAAIGGGSGGDADTIRITGGTVTANGYVSTGADRVFPYGVGIGSGLDGKSANNIILSGGTITVQAACLFGNSDGSRKNLQIQPGTGLYAVATGALQGTFLTAVDLPTNTDFQNNQQTTITFQQGTFSWNIEQNALDFGEIFQETVPASKKINLTHTGTPLPQTELKAEWEKGEQTAFIASFNKTTVESNKTVAVTVAPKENLAPGTYSDTLYISSKEQEKGAKITVTVTVKEKKKLEVKESPAAEETVYGTPLSEIKLSGGKVTAEDEEVEGTWSWAVEEPQNVYPTATGTPAYEAVFTPDENQEFYQELRISVTPEIQKATPTISWTQENKTQTVTYTGTAAVIQAPVVTLRCEEIYEGAIQYAYRTAGEETAAFTEGLPTDAGTYEIQASIEEQDNYEKAQTTQGMALCIEKITPEITIHEDYQGKIYDGVAMEQPTKEEVSVSGAPYDRIHFVWYEDNNGTKGEQRAEAPKNAGTYWVEGTISADTNNNRAVSAPKKVTITKRTAELVWSETTWTYGENKELTASVANLAAEESCTVTVENGKQTDAGTYRAQATELSNANYQLSETTTKNYTIKKAATLARTQETVTVTKNNSQTVKTDLSALLAEEPVEGEEGFVYSLLTEETQWENLGVRKASQEGSILTITTIGSTKETSGELAVSVSGLKNYEECRISVPISRISRKSLTITGVEAEEGLTYNYEAQKGYTGNPAAKGYDGEFDILYTGRNETQYGPTENAPEAMGDYTVTFAIPEENNTYEGKLSLDFSIGEQHPLSGTLSIDGSCHVGETLTAVPKDVQENANLGFQWYRVDAEGTATEIAEAQEASYKITEADMGYRLKVEASCPKLYQGSMQSETGALVTKVTQLTVKLETKACVYEAKEIKPAAEVFDGEKKLTEDTDYILQYLDNKKAGEAKVIVQGTGRYEGSEGTAIFTIQPRPVTVTGATVEDKKYDGTVTANVTGVTLDGILSEDSVSYQAQGTFTDEQPGTEKTVEITVALTGNDKGNYTLTGSPFVAKASIYRVVSDTPAKEPELSKKEQEQVEKLEATKPKEQEPEATKNTVKLTWEKIKNADGYAIYRYDPDTGKYVLIKKTEKTSFTDKNLKTATGYQYKIKAYKKVGTKTVYSKGKKITAATTVPVPQNAQIKKVSGNSSRTKAELSWKKAAKADGYYIYEYKASKHKFQLIGKIKDGKQYRYNAKKKTWHFERKVSQNGNRIVYRMKDLNFTKERMYQYRVRSYIRYNKTSIKSKATLVLRLQR